LRQEGPQGDGGSEEAVGEEAAEGAKSVVNEVGGEVLLEGEALGLLELLAAGGR
jgi:hypothetical protein